MRFFSDGEFWTFINGCMQIHSLFLLLDETKREGNETLESSRNEENKEYVTYTSSSAMMELVLRNRSAMERKKTPNYKSNSMQVKESRVQLRGLNMGLNAAQTRKSVWINSYYEFRQKRRFFS